MKNYLMCIWLALTMTGLAATVAEWNFDQPGNLRDWNPNAHMTNTVATAGAITFRGAGSNPILEFRGALEFKATPLQQIEIRLKADHDGEARFFWSNTNAGRFGGFEPAKRTDFIVNGDGQWHTYRVWPFWQAEKKITRLRLDTYDNASFAIESIRITELPPRDAVAMADFDFTNSDQNWQANGEVRAVANPGGLNITMAEANDYVFSPPVSVPSDEQGMISLRMAVDKGRRATLCYATDAAPGLQHQSFSIVSDGSEHTYNIDLAAAKEWRGHIVVLGLAPSEIAGANARLRWLKVSDEPQGPAQITVRSFATIEALPRAGITATLQARIENTGGASATNLRATLTLPADMKAAAQSRPASFGVGETAEFLWKLDAPKPAGGDATLAIAADGADVATTHTTIAFTPRINVPNTGYVPEPHPVRGPFEVGVYYFPGWNTPERWQPMQGFPERRPVLGFYREGDPEVADWQIKWAVEHGITYFVYDWYWNQGARHLEHGLHDAYFKSRYHHLLKFCLLWANHNPPKTSSLEDCRAVTRYWIANYFRRPEHLTVDGKPVMIIFSPHRLSDDLGSGKVKDALDLMRAECRNAGLPGLHLVACVGNLSQAKECATEGYDAVTCYNWAGLGRATTENYAPYETLVPAYRKQWEQIRDGLPIPLAPLPVCGGWDSRPWHGDNNLVRYGRAPELFKRHLQDAKEFLLQPQSRGSKLALIEAWNEWGEGSYIEPHREFGFGYLDAIRDVFTDASAKHDDVTPTDAGLGPYDLQPPAPPKTSWDFAQGESGWSRTMGFNGTAITNGALAGHTSSRDPAFFSPTLEAKAEKFSTVIVRMKLARADRSPLQDKAQLFWRTSRLPESEASSLHFDVAGDGQWHDYSIPVATNKRWRGIITGIRVDPCNVANVNVEISRIELR